MKEEFWKTIETFEEEHSRGVGKADFACVFGSAFLKAAQVELVKVAFSATGIVPFKPHIVSAEKLKPSKPTSVKGGFPLVQPSPVRAVVEHLTLYHPTDFDLDPDHARRPSAPLGSIPELPETDPNVEPLLQPLQTTTRHPHHSIKTPIRTINKPRPFTPSKMNHP
ncbi:hypothetical protein M422DRAFT_249865 [Sphaerobolus stellatus SS14]|uniref:Uncharacterized protein n=1 Tax=Sphaerobolus stellatus (strain SS14) TaxID=990650 RepID=A0A0C9UUG7_SPHS4|nr:hypothetical protein M422DRAFT_249865 [Sphaerobolus stellatus SS14]